MDNNRKAFIYSLAAGFFAVWLVFTYVSQKENAFQKEFGERVTVLVASRDINPMDQITEGAIQSQIIPKKFLQPGAVLASNQKELLNSSPIAAVPFKAGEQIVDTKFLWEGSQIGLSAKVGVGMRAISIPVNDQYGVTKLIKPGDRVDVLSPVRFVSGDIDRIEIKTVLQNMLVLATGERVSWDPPRTMDTDPFSGRRYARSLQGDRTFNTVTLEVTPNQAQSIVYIATQAGVLYLTLRAPTDGEVDQSLRTTNQEDVLGSGSIQLLRERQPAAGTAGAPGGRR